MPILLEKTQSVPAVPESPLGDIFLTKFNGKAANRRQFTDYIANNFDQLLEITCANTLITDINTIVNFLAGDDVNQLHKTWARDVLEETVELLGMTISYHKGLVVIKHKPNRVIGKYDSFVDNYGVVDDSGNTWLLIDSEEVTAARALSYLSSGDTYKPVLNLRIRSDADKIGRASCRERV